jgi:hypothetical protein
MLINRIKRMTIAAAAAVLLASCGESEVTPVNPEPLPLGTGIWFLNTVDDSILGSTIATRTVGVAIERTVVDSGSLFVGSDGGYEQRYWLRIFVSGALDREETVIDLGTWSALGLGFTFTSSVRNRSFTITPVASNRLMSAEPMVFFAGAPITEGVYRRTRP